MNTYEAVEPDELRRELKISSRKENVIQEYFRKRYSRINSAKK